MAGALIGALRVSLSAETSAFEAGMKRAQKTAQTTANRIKSSFGSIGGELRLLGGALGGFIGALSVGTLIAAAKAGLEYAGSLGEIAQGLGVTTRELQTFRFAVEQNGGTAEQADLALGRLAIGMSKAQQGSKQAAAAFGSVGVKLTDLRNLSKQEILGKIADNMKATGGAANNAAAGVAIFGKGFLKIAPALDQGSAGLNELAKAAETLGIVLSDKQIQQADDTADKLDALQTVLKAQIAGVVADNADAILGLANAIAEVAREAANAIGKLRGFYDTARIAAAQAEIWLSKRFDAGILGQLGIGNQTRAQNRAAAQGEIDAIHKRQGADRLAALFRGRPRTGGGGIPPAFLGGGGGGRSSRGRADHSAEKAERERLQALRDQNQFDQEIRRAKIDVLNATRDLATDAVEQYQISVDIKDAERAAYESQLKYEVAAGERTEVQAQQLQLEYDRKDQLERDKLKADENHRAFEESARLDDLQFDLQRDKLQSEEQLAETASEQRDVQLRLLDLAYRQERARLNTILADEQSSEAAKEEARRRLANLNKTYGNDRQGVINSTRGPMEDYLASLPTTAAKAQEALERLEVQGFEGLIDASLALSDGFKSAKDALLQTLKDFLLGLARMNLQRGLAGLLQGGGGSFLGSLFGGGSSAAASSGFLSSGIENNVLFGGGLPAFANGGSFRILGRRGRDQNVLSLNGLPIARVNYGERATFSNDNVHGARSGGSGWFGDMIINTPDADSFRRNSRQIARATNRRLAQS